MKFVRKVWRHIPPGSFALHVGRILGADGRWNRVNMYGCFYTALTKEGAIEEWRRTLAWIDERPKTRDRVSIEFASRVLPALAGMEAPHSLCKLVSVPWACVKSGSSPCSRCFGEPLELALKGSPVDVCARGCIIIVDTEEAKMKTRVQRWGNSLAVRIPKAFAMEVGLSDETPIVLRVSRGAIVVEPFITAPSLGDLVRGITEANLHREIDTGRPVGEEAW